MLVYHQLTDENDWTVTAVAVLSDQRECCRCGRIAFITLWSIWNASLMSILCAYGSRDTHQCSSYWMVKQTNKSTPPIPPTHPPTPKNKQTKNNSNLTTTTTTKTPTKDTPPPQPPTDPPPPYTHTTTTTIFKCRTWCTYFCLVTKIDRL